MRRGLKSNIAEQKMDAKETPEERRRQQREHKRLSIQRLSIYLRCRQGKGCAIKGI